MFKEFMGLPLHPLAVHAAVVLVPLLVLGSIAYAVLPRFRRRSGWLLWALAVLTPVATFVAVESGEALQEVLIEKQYPANVLDSIVEHGNDARMLFLVTLCLGIATILQLLFVGTLRGSRLPRWVTPVLVVVVLTIAGTDLVYIYLTGDSGARAAWTGVL